MDKEFPPFEYGVSRVLDCGFIIEEAVSPTREKIGIGYGLNFQFEVENSWVQFIIKASFNDSESNIDFIQGTVLTKFVVHELINFVDENNKVKFPNGALETLFGLSFSHLRAILAKNTAGSKFAFLYIPVINPTDLFSELIAHNNQHSTNEMRARADSIDKIDDASIGVGGSHQTPKKFSSKKILK